MQKICQFFASKYDKWKLGLKNTSSDNDSDVDSNDDSKSGKYIDVGLEFKHLVNIFIVIL